MVTIIFRLEYVMWYEFATNRKMIDSMFPLGFEITKPELSSVTIVGNDIKLSMNCNEIPDSYPKKWKDRKFNAMHIVVELGDVINFKYDGGQLGWFDNFEFSGSGMSSDKNISITTDTFDLECFYKYLTIRSIEPYEDTRWE